MSNKKFFCAKYCVLIALKIFFYRIYNFLKKKYFISNDA